MTWREQLRKASFRGVEFFVEEIETPFGRRKVLHEYPLRDKPYAEDLGRKAREYTVRAYVLGDNYISKRNALIEAIEQKSEPGTLVHPTFGSVQVVPTECRNLYSNKEGGIEYFDLVFVESGENRYPSQTLDTMGIVGMRGDQLLSTLNQVFTDRFSVDNLPQFVADSAVQIGQDFADRLSTVAGIRSRLAEQASTVLASISDFRGNLNNLIQSPADFVSQVGQLVAAIQSIYQNPSDAYHAYRELLSFGEDYPPVSPTTTTRIQQAANMAIQIQVARRAALIGMANVVTQIQFDSYDDAVEVRDELAGYMDDELISLGSTDDDQAYLDLEGLRAAAIRDVTERAANLERIKQIVNQTSLPALVTSYNLYDTSDRADEIVSRNKVRHPGFLPAGRPLQVLTA